MIADPEPRSLFTFCLTIAFFLHRTKGWEKEGPCDGPQVDSSRQNEGSYRGKIRRGVEHRAEAPSSSSWRYDDSRRRLDDRRRYEEQQATFGARGGGGHHRYVMPPHGQPAEHGGRNGSYRGFVEHAYRPFAYGNNWATRYGADYGQNGYDRQGQQDGGWCRARGGGGGFRRPYHRAAEGQGDAEGPKGPGHRRGHAH